MHVLAPKPTNKAIPIFFNVDSTVGNRGANSNKNDILLVQFLIRKSAELAIGTLRPDRRQRMLRVTPDGRVGPLTIDGIKAVQETMREKTPSTVVDGRISPARGYHYGGGFYTIVSMNNAVRKRRLTVWPRLQDLPGFPAAIKPKFQESM